MYELSLTLQLMLLFVARHLVIAYPSSASFFCLASHRRLSHLDSHSLSHRVCRNGPFPFKKFSIVGKQPSFSDQEEFQRQSESAGGWARDTIDRLSAMLRLLKKGEGEFRRAFILPKTGSLPGDRRGIPGFECGHRLEHNEGCEDGVCQELSVGEDERDTVCGR